MTLSTIDLALRVGPGLPDLAPGHLMRALRRVEVTQQDTAPCGFQLHFLAELVSQRSDFQIVADPLLAPFSRVLLRVAVDGVPTTLIDGFITHQQYMPGNGPDDSMFVVTGEDVSVKLDLVGYSREYPAMADAELVLELLAPWALLGIVPEVLPSAQSLVPIDFVPQQSETDRALLRRLAEQNGNVFYVAPTPIPFTNTAYWGPPIRIGAPTALIDVAVGAGSTADAFSAEYDALAPVAFVGESIETTIEPYEPLPVLTTGSTRFPPLASRPALSPATLLEGGSRIELWRDDELDPVRANLRAQAMTDLSTDAVVQVSCSVTPARLGTVVSAPGMVGVRGTGDSYDGMYYLKSATHQIGLASDEQWNYTQQLVMTREGVGTTTSTLEVP